MEVTYAEARVSTQTQKAYCQKSVTWPRAGGRQAVGVVGRLHGWTALGFQSPPTDSRTLARIPEPWFHLGREACFYHEMTSQVCMIRNTPTAHTHTASTHLSVHPLHPLPSVRRCFQLFSQGLRRIPRPATALLQRSFGP